MSERLNPARLIQKIQKAKYKAATLPILIVILGLISGFILPNPFTKYLSLFGLGWFFYISLKFRINKVISANSNKFILAPVSGKIVEKNSNSLKIKKRIFSPCDIRFPGSSEEISYSINGKKIVFFEEESSLKGKLIGFTSSAVECICKFNNDCKITVRIGEEVSAGESVLAIKK